MTKDDIIRMAQESVLDATKPFSRPKDPKSMTEFCLSFAERIAAAERERVAGYMTRRGYEPTSTNDIVEMLEEMFWFSEERFLKSVRTQVVGDALVAAVKAEREACAKMVEEWITHPHLASAIRARGHDETDK